MRHPDVGRIGATSAARGVTTPDTWFQAALPQNRDETPAASVVRKTPRPTGSCRSVGTGLAFSVVIAAPSHVGHAGEELAAQLAGVALRGDPDRVLLGRCA